MGYVQVWVTQSFSYEEADYSHMEDLGQGSSPLLYCGEKVEIERPLPNSQLILWEPALHQYQSQIKTLQERKATDQYLSWT